MLDTVATMLTSSVRDEAADTIAFLDNLKPEQQKDFFAFLQGVRFAQSVAADTAPQASCARS